MSKLFWLCVVGMLALQLSPVYTRKSKSGTESGTKSGTTKTSTKSGDSSEETTNEATEVVTEEEGTEVATEAPTKGGLLVSDFVDMLNALLNGITESILDAVGVCFVSGSCMNGTIADCAICLAGNIVVPPEITFENC